MPVHGTEGHIDHRGSKRQCGSSLPTFLISPLMERGEEMALRVSIREGWTTQPYTRVGDVPNPQRSYKHGVCQTIAVSKEGATEQRCELQAPECCQSLC